MARVRFENVSKDWGAGVVALDRVNLEVADGELMVVVGPSGCGKTTLLRLVAGLERPTQGSLRLDDQVINEVPPQDRNVAMVFQNYALYPHLSVRQNLAFALRFRPGPRAESAARVREVAALLGLEDLLERKPAALSGGQRQRVALGRAMVQRPCVFLFDEPLSNLDPQARVRARRELRALHRRLRTTTLYVTHDQGEAMTLGDRLAVLCAGTIRQVGRPLEVFDHPADKFVASFIGTPPMNFFEGTIRAGAQGVLFVTADGPIPLPAGLARQALAAGDGERTLGIRPGNLHWEPVEGEAAGPWLGRVDSVETSGDRLDVRIRTRSGTEFTVSADPQRPPRPGGLVRATPNPAGIRIFEKGPFGRNVASENSTGPEAGR